MPGALMQLVSYGASDIWYGIREGHHTQNAYPSNLRDTISNAFFIKNADGFATNNDIETNDTSIFNHYPKLLKPTSLIPYQVKCKDNKCFQCYLNNPNNCIKFIKKPKCNFSKNFTSIFTHVHQDLQPKQNSLELYLI